MDQQDDNQLQDYLIHRTRAPSTNAAVFLETNAVIPSAFGASHSVYIESLDRFGSVAEARTQEQINVQLWKQANTEVDKLFALIDQVRAKMDKKSSSRMQQPARLPVDLRKCTWDQVMGEVQSTATRWSTTSKKSSKIITCLDKLGRNSDAFKSWLELLPAGDYGSMLLVLLHVEAIILETLAEIPEVMSDAKRYIEIYSKCRDQLLEKRTFELYLSILRNLTHVMQFFADPSVRKFYQPILKQSSYKSELVASCKDIKTRASRVKNEARICMQKHMVDMNQSLLDTNDKTTQALDIMQNVYRLLLSSEALAVKMPGPGSYDYNFLEMQAIHDSKSFEDVPERNIERAKNLLELLQYDPDVVLTDTATCLRLGDVMGEDANARASALVKSPMFKDFMTENASSGPLLVNGNEDLSSAEGLSPLSLIAARLVHIAEQTESTRGLCLGYFCAEHAPYSNECQASSPAGTMMASLTGQLVTHMLSRSVEIDLSYLAPARWAALEKQNLTAICSTFYEIVKQLPSKTVLLCVLDEVALYETGVPQRDLDIVIRRLVRLVEGCDEIIFKILVTCRGRAIGIGQYFSGHILDLEEDVEAEDSSVWQIENIG